MQASAPIPGPFPRITLAVLVAVAVVGAGGGPAHAGPWVPEPGAGYAKIGVRWLPGFFYFPGPEHAAEQGWSGPQPYGSYHELFVEAYGELGIAPGLALTFGDQLIRGFFLDDARDGPAGPLASPGEPGLGLQVGLIREGRFVSSMHVAVRAPLVPGEPVRPVHGTADGNPQVGELRIATGVWELDSSLAAGVGWDRGYLAVVAGAVVRGGGFDTLLRWSVEGGVPLGRGGRSQGRLRLTGQHPLANGDAPYHRSPSGIGNGTRFLAFTLEFERRIAPRIWLGASLAGGMGAVARQTGGPVVTVYLALDGGKRESGAP
jgi:hypothetical protein